MGPYYKSITSASNILALDKTLLAEMEAANEEELKKLDERLAEAEKIEGESEISDALKARANYLTRIGDKVCLVFLDDFALCNSFRSDRCKPKSLHSKKRLDLDHASTSHSPSSVSGSSSPTPIL